MNLGLAVGTAAWADDEDEQHAIFVFDAEHGSVFSYA